MLSLPTAVKIYLARGATDMRKSIDGLSGLVQHQLAQDPISGHLFVFCNRGRDRIKILYWEQSGYWLLHKRLEKGTFAWPVPAECATTQIEMTSAELAVMLSGIDLQHAKKRRWYSRTA